MKSSDIDVDTISMTSRVSYQQAVCVKGVVEFWRAAQEVRWFSLEDDDPNASV